MRKFLIAGAFLIAVAGLSLAFLYPQIGSIAEKDLPFDGDEPDMPSFLQNSISKEEYMRLREQNIAQLRGIKEGETVDPQLRQDAIEKLDDQLRHRAAVGSPDALAAAWTELGPNPIPNGQVVSGPQLAVSGRTISIAVHPTNPNIVYVGTAHGGLYRTTDGGATWTPMMDNALSLVIGAVAIAPSQPDTVYVGTGEPNFSLDSFFGVGVYRIDNASSANPVLTGPLNKDASNNDIFSGRGISEIMVHPTDPATIFVSTTSGSGGISGAASPTQPSRGIYRSNNATSASPTFAKLTGLANNVNASVRDIAIDPLNPNLLVANVVASGGTGGLYTSTNALSAAPAFTQTYTVNSGSTSELTGEFAVQHTAGNANPVFYAALGQGSGRIMTSTDGGATWTQQIANSFCGGQCFYNIAVAVDPTNPARVYIGGTGSSTTFAISTTSATSFTSSASGLHTDSHVIAVAPSDPTVVYFGSDGGIYKSTNSGASWATLNNTTYRATQFISIAVHPIDPNFSIGGTQDNGTNFYRPDGTWIRSDGGDGGYSLIDQNATDTTNVRMYHTYYNQGPSLLGYATTATATGGWTFRGCNGSNANGINCSDPNTLFYAPLEQGPGNPNTVYYGTDRLYRSADTGLNNTVVSQGPIQSGVPLSAIGIAPQNDNIRIVGLTNGGLWGTTTGSSVLTDLDPSNTVPNSFIARAIIAPSNPNKAYVSISAFGVVNAWKTSNLNAAAPTWTAAAGSGATALPQVPVSAFIVDTQNPNTLFAGTDIGVYVSYDDGGSWSPLGTGLPRVAVFDMAITSAHKLRIATHGRGFFEISIDAPSARTPFDFDGDGKSDISVFRPASGIWYIQQSQNGFAGFTFGQAGDVIAPADFDGDGKTDLAVFRNGSWYIQRSTAGFTGVSFGQSGDLPRPADFDGDGKADIAIFRPSSGQWYYINSSNMTVSGITFGQNGDAPVPGDYDGDGKADVAVFRPSTGIWYLNRSTAGFTGITFGQAGDVPVPANYDGDLKTDIAVFRNGAWYGLNSSNGSFFGVSFGQSGDIPVPADYDGDGKADIGVFRPSIGTWYIQRTTSGFYGLSFGASTDKPVPSAFQP